MDNVIQLTPKPKVEAPVVVRPTEILRELKVFQAERICSKCPDENGRMIPKPFNVAMATWTTNQNSQTAFPHVCNGCGHEESYPERYPALRYGYADGGT